MKTISLFKDYSIYSQYVLVLLCAAKGIQVKKEWQPFLYSERFGFHLE